jgi:endothelin-converting enzyme/putative endopeptidase
MRSAIAFLTVFVATCAAVPAAARQTAAPAPAATPPAPADQPYAQLPYTPSLDLAAMDPGVDPCVDLYTYACGGWKKRNPLPPDRSSWSVYGKTNADNLQFLWGMLEAAAKPDPGRDPSQALIGDYFAACMDEAAAERAGIAPLQAELEAIDRLAKPAELAPLLARLQLATGQGGFLMHLGSAQDLKQASQVIGWLSVGGLGLPDRDDYLDTDTKSVEIRDKYRAHVARMLTLLGDSPAAAKAGAEAVLRIETELAKVSLTRVERRTPSNLDHPMTPAELAKAAPGLDWRAYLAAFPTPAPLARLNIEEPKFFARAAALVASEPLAAWKTYLRWHLVDSRAPFLSRALVEADFDFYQRTLRGVEQQQPRWKRCVSLVDNQLGEALGKVFVEKTFSADTKARTLDMVERIERVMERRIQALAWMSAPTRQEALRKLHGLRNKIGYPDRWRDYSSVRVERTDLVGNVSRAAAFEEARQLAKIGRPVDRGEWGMTPPTVNAYYNPSMNDINFPAGVLQPPLFDPKLDDAPNYGNTGGTIGHELIHGFDDEGRQFDADGNLRDWWTADDAKRFAERAQCVADQYAQYVVIDDIKINSKLTLGEDVADLAGLQLAWDAWKDATAAQQPAPRDGLSPEQRFFVGFAQWACANVRDETKRLNARTNPHSPPEYRINGVVVNMPEFAQAFSCQPGQPMVKPPAAVCRIW